MGLLFCVGMKLLHIHGHHSVLSDNTARYLACLLIPH